MLPSAEELIKARSEVVQLSLEVLAERIEPPREDEYKALRMRNVLKLGRAAEAYEAARVIQDALVSRQVGCTKQFVNDSLVMEVIRCLESDKGFKVRDNFTDELQTLIDLAYHAGYYREVQWVTSIWTNFKPLPIALPSSA